MMKIAMLSTYASGSSRRFVVALIAADATQAPRSRAMISCVSWIRKSMKKVTRGGFSSSFGPSSASCFAACAAVTPRSTSL